MFNFLHGYGPSLLKGAFITVTLSLVSLFIAISLGLITASMKLSKNKVFEVIGGIYTTIIRGIPDLVMMLLLFYGGQVLVSRLSKG